MPNLHDTLDQTEWWYGQDGYPYRLTEMEQSHRINVVNFLLRRARNIYERHQWLEFRVMQNAPEEVFNEWMHQYERAVSSEPEEWLKRTPLMQALDKLIKDHDTVDGEVVSNEVVVTQPSDHTMSPTGRFRVNKPLRLQPIKPERFSD
jgi:hypothetical protein